MKEINNILSEDEKGWENSPKNILSIIKEQGATSPNMIKKIKKWVTSQPEYEDGKYKVMTSEPSLPTETPLLSRKPSLERTLSEMSYGSSPEAPDYYPVFLEFMQKYSKDIQENLTELGSTELDSSQENIKKSAENFVQTVDSNGAQFTEINRQQIPYAIRNFPFLVEHLYNKLSLKIKPGKNLVIIDTANIIKGTPLTNITSNDQLIWVMKSTRQTEFTTKINQMNRQETQTIILADVSPEPTVVGTKEHPNVAGQRQDVCKISSCGEENHDICTYDDLVIWLLYFGCKYYYKVVQFQSDR